MTTDEIKNYSCAYNYGDTHYDYDYDCKYDYCCASSYDNSYDHGHSFR